MIKYYMIITNNPLVPKKLDDSRIVIYRDISYEDVLKEVRDRIHEGHRLLSHPLSGSVKPNETPYKSVMISTGKGEIDEESLAIIENAIQACRKFAFKSDMYKPSVYEDFQLDSVGKRNCIGRCMVGHWGCKSVAALNNNIIILRREPKVRLEMGHIYIKDIQFAAESKIEDGILYVSEEAVKAVALEDEKIKSVSFDIAKPGESVRITPVKDVIEPRVKVEGRGGIFPGVIAKVDTVGEGKTYALKGMAVVTAGKIVGFQEGIIDMTGPGADYTPFSKTLNLVMVCEPVDGIKQHDYEKAVRFAGFRVAVYLGELARNLTPDETKVYETCTIKEGMEKYPNLPRVAYVQMLQSQGLLHDTYVYGVDAKKIVPTILSPTEVMDGAIVSGNCVSACDKNPTYVHLNNPVVHDMFEQHGKTINFVCQIITNENVYLADKQRSSDWTAKLCKMLDLDGVIVSQEGFGNPDTDLIMNCKKIEAEGVKTVIITDEYAGRDGKSQSLADSDPAADAVVTGGNANQVVILPKLDKVIGTLDYVTKIAGASEETLREDGSLEVELQVLTGATNETGFNKLSAR